MGVIDPPAPGHWPVVASGGGDGGAAHVLRSGLARIPSWVCWGAGSGAVAALPLIAGLVALSRAGWAPFDDEATIAWRSWDVFAGHGPLVGPYTMASLDLHHPVFDPGPLLYWALVIPVHLSPRIGLLTGVTLLGVASVVIACLAASAVGGRVAAVVVGLGAVTVGWSVSAAVDSMLWNPYAGLAPFGATLVVAWTVAAGRLGWWPCLVVLASFCAQTHLMFAAGSVLLLVVAPILGMIAARRSKRAAGWRWIAVGVTLGAICWAAPVWQQLTARRGNLAALWTATFHRDVTLGWDFGLKSLSRAVALPRPVWLRSAPSSAYPVRCQLFDQRCFLPEIPLAWALVAFVALAVVTVVAYRYREHRAVALSAVALIGDLSAVWMIDGIPQQWQRGLFSIVYLQYVLWLVGAMTWFAVGYGLVALARRPVVTFLSAHAANPRQLAGRAAAVALALTLIVAATFASHGQYRDAASRAGLGPSGARTRLNEAADRIAAMVGPALRKHSRLAIETTPVSSTIHGNIDTSPMVLRVAYLLRTRGWTPAMIAPYRRAQLDPVYTARPDDLVLEVTSDPVSTSARVLGRVDYPAATLFSALLFGFHENMLPARAAVWSPSQWSD